MIESIVGNEVRQSLLKNLLENKKHLRIMEAHSPISALIAEKTIYKTNKDNLEYDGFWSSSLTDSTLRGEPDIELLDVKERLTNVNEIFDVTSKPLIFDGDTGGKTEHFAHNVRALDRAGVSAIIIEDKKGLKRNSLLGNDVYQQQEDIETFCNKIRVGIENRIHNDFMIIARIESLILEKGMDDALKRADAYVNAGADGIMVHSRKKDPADIMYFASEFRKIHKNVPLICVPTSYAQVPFEILAEAGFNIVIYANHLFRSSYLAMKNVAYNILKYDRTLEVENECLKIKDILSLNNI